jgi:hypothetical protein
MSDIKNTIIKELLSSGRNNIEYIDFNKLTIYYFKPESEPGKMYEEKISSFIDRISGEIEKCSNICELKKQNKEFIRCLSDFLYGDYDIKDLQELYDKFMKETKKSDE